MLNPLVLFQTKLFVWNHKINFDTKGFNHKFVDHWPEQRENFVRCYVHG